MTDEELIALHKDMMLGVEAGYHYPPKAAQMMHDRIEALIAERDQNWDSFVHWRKEADDRSEQLAAARQDAKEAEAYAEELERDGNALFRRVALAEEWRDHDKTRAEAAEAKLAKAVEVLTKIAKYDHQAAAMRVLSLKDEQPFAMHLAPTPHPTKDRDTAVLLMAVASTDIAGWAAVTLAEIKGESHE